MIDEYGNVSQSGNAADPFDNWMGERSGYDMVGNPVNTQSVNVGGSDWYTQGLLSNPTLLPSSKKTVGIGLRAAAKTVAPTQVQVAAPVSKPATPTTTAYTVPLPTVPTSPTFQAPTYTPPTAYEGPTYDLNRVESLTQRAAAPGLRKLRNAVSSAANQYYANPNVKAMTLRQALEGYGTGLESVMSSAHSTAASEYGTEYAGKVDTAKTQYQGNLQTAQMNYQGAYNTALANYNQSLAKWKLDYERAVQDWLYKMKGV